MNAFDNMILKAYLILELMVLTLLLLFPFERLGPYSRVLFEEKVIGDYWLLNKKMGSIPEEARKHFLNAGRILFSIFVFFMVRGLIRLLTNQG